MYPGGPPATREKSLRGGHLGQAQLKRLATELYTKARKVSVATRLNEAPSERERETESRKSDNVPSNMQRGCCGMQDPVELHLGLQACACELHFS